MQSANSVTLGYNNVNKPLQEKEPHGDVGAWGVLVAFGVHLVPGPEPDTWRDR